MEEEERDEEEEEGEAACSDSGACCDVVADGGETERPRPKSWACSEERREPEERRRRRQTAAPLLLSEALSSLLWVPYDVQQSEPCPLRHNMDTGDPSPESDTVPSGVAVHNVSVVRVNQTASDNRTFADTQVQTEDARRPRRHRHPRLPDLLDLPPPYSPPPPLGLPTTFHHIIPSRRRCVSIALLKISYLSLLSDNDAIITVYSCHYHEESFVKPFSCVLVLDFKCYFSEPTIDTITVMISTFSGLYYNRTNENFIEFIREV